MVSPYRAKSLDTLVAQVNQYAPHRKKGDDGWIGDEAHQARTSDHNPNSLGAVCAQDFTHDPSGGFDSYDFAEKLVQSKDGRIKYVISNRRIAYGPRSPSYGGDPGSWWKWNPYHGADPHTGHVHISVGGGPKYYDDPKTWDVLGQEIILPSDQSPSWATGKAGWYSQYTGQYRWRDSGDKPGSNALKVQDNHQGVAFYNSATLGHWFKVTAPNGKTLLLVQSDIGPAPWTGRKIDISAVAAEAFGYTPKDFPTGATFSWQPADPPPGSSARDQAMRWDVIKQQTLGQLANPAPVLPVVTQPLPPAVQAVINHPVTEAVMTNWKTSLSGLFVALVAVASLFGVSIPGTTPMDTSSAIAAIIGAIGLFVAKDHNK